MSIVVDILKEIAPEFASEDAARLDLFVELAAARISAPVFGKVYPQALAYLAAFLLGWRYVVALAGKVPTTACGACTPVCAPADDQGQRSAWST